MPAPCGSGPRVVCIYGERQLGTKAYVEYTELSAPFYCIL